MILAANLGFPRIGIKRELKKATEAYWRGDIDYAELRRAGAELRARHWLLQKQVGIDVIPSNDFSFYDQMLDMAAAVGAVPPRFRTRDLSAAAVRVAAAHRTASAYAVMADIAELADDAAGSVDFDTYFAMARGTAAAPAMEMTKWFDTNYHYIVPEFHADQTFRLTSRKAIEEFKEAKALGIETRPVLVGPVTFLSLGKAKDAGLDPLTLLDALLPVYVELLSGLVDAGAEWVQLDEPILALDLSEAQIATLNAAYATLAGAGAKVLIATYFGGLGDNLDVVARLPVDGLHVDLVRGGDDLDRVLQGWPWERVLSLGVIDGRNIWRADLDAAFAKVQAAVAARGQGGIQIAPSCSLSHCPVDLDADQTLDPEIKSWMAYARQKLGEVAALKTAATQCRGAASAAFAESAAALAARRARAATGDPAP